jgi:hypothetical protein
MISFSLTSPLFKEFSLRFSLTCPLSLKLNYIYF